MVHITTTHKHYKLLQCWLPDISLFTSKHLISTETRPSNQSMI